VEIDVLPARERLSGVVVEARTPECPEAPEPNLLLLSLWKFLQLDGLHWMPPIADPAQAKAVM
jgi:hypothetical protein